MGKLNDYFSFSRGEKRGVIVLFLIILLLIVGFQFIDYYNLNKTTDFSDFENAINQFEKERNLKSEKEVAEIELFDFNPNTISDDDWSKLGFADWQIKIINKYKSKGGNWKVKNDVAKIYGLDSNHFEQLKPYILLPEKINSESNDFSKKENKIEPTYFEFNPNTITKSEWKKLGFEDWQIKTIFNYKAKGGGWKTKADVKKIYGLEEADYFKLKPFILLPDKTEETTFSKKEKNYSQKVNVNSATEKELTHLKGINSEKYAAIIIKYRTNLGGFIKKEQLKEVWNLSEETYNGFESQIELGNINPTQININTDEIKDLTKHPYIDWKTGNAIIKYRKANGNYKSVNDIKKIHLISNETYLVISPYLTVN